MSKRRRLSLLALLLILLALIALFLTRCTKPDATSPETVAAMGAPSGTPAAEAPAVEAPAAAEVLTPATLQAPANVVAGASFDVHFTGPRNPRDYITLVRADDDATAYGNYANTESKDRVKLTAPIEAGDYELRYVADRSKTVLGRTPIVVTDATASVSGPSEAILGTVVSVSWTGPDNKGDYITIVAKGTPDGQYGNYTETIKGSPLQLTLPVDTGDGELRYMTGQGGKVLARSPIKILAPEVSLDAPKRVVAGTVFQVSWTGPNNHGDYVTIVPKESPDGRYENYTETSKGSPMKVTALIEPGSAELRYMTGTGARVLNRRPIEIVAAEITLEAPAEVTAGAPVEITWKGPKNGGDYITIVPRTLPDGQYARYADCSKGSPLTVESPSDSGAAEIRYMSGQGAKVLARRPLNVVPQR